MQSDRGARRWRLVRAAPAAIPPSVRRFNQRARQRRIATAKPWAVGAAVLACAGLTSWIVFGTSVLGVHDIKVRGGGFVSNEAIRHAAGVPIGTPLTLVNSGAAARRVERLAAVKTATVVCDWPRTLVITVTLRQAIAAVPMPGNLFVLVDKTGTPFRTVGSSQGLPVIHTGSADLTDRAARMALTAATDVLASLPPELSAKLVRIEAVSDTEVELMLVDDREIVWGDASDNQQKARVALSLLEHPGKIIDVSAPGLVTVQ